MRQVHTDAMDTALCRWLANGGGTLKAFNTFIGRKNLSDHRWSSWGFYELTKLGADRVEMLNGPHYVAVIKAYLAREGIT